MYNKPSRRNKLKVTRNLSLGLIILGFSFITWSLIQIHGQSVSLPEIKSSPKLTTSITPKIEQVETIKHNDNDKNSNMLINQILYPIRPIEGENIGNLSIPKLDQTIPILHGTNEDELKKGIGHFSGSVLPGEKDNTVLSGHRDTVFKKLGQLEIKDELIVQTSAGIFTYEIKKIQIVDKDDKTIISPTDHAVLTVTTCYPFEYIGSAPDRYILIADLISSEIVQALLR
jgi:sortase A